METKCLNDFLPNPIGLVLIIFLMHFISKSSHSEGGNTSPASMSYRLAIFKFILFQKLCHTRKIHVIPVGHTQPS